MQPTLFYAAALLSSSYLASASPKEATVYAFASEACITDTFTPVPQNVDSAALVAKHGFSDSGMTLERCADFCILYTVMGVKNGRECHSGNSIRAGTISTLANCGIPCSGNSGQLCRGNRFMNTYQLAGFAGPAGNFNV
ncbi:hypothetical protein HYALB_00010619 [Hymenoscyphus albidus]|uniref:WSC domain-containing protein n=1 Tax=Hymenoscyphus albidus TaxID=595503 RepID=A0A9N9PVH0_9HELO|nr:hypothetical protein HYALB_00010619 [Hymenoscyphus albidus]